MSKAVLISIKPKWVEKIASGEKTVEVRRTAPQLSPPFKCYIYCTRNARDLDKLWVLNEQRRQEYGGLTAVCANLAERPNCHYCGNGKVIGEFVCDKISEIGFSPWSHGEYVSDIENLHKASCLNFDEMFSYLEDGVGYGWHISSLKIYDKPRELSEFGRGCDAENINEIRCRDCKKLVSFDDICEVMCKPLNRPPQSWCYVEVYK